MNISCGNLGGQKGQLSFGGSSHRGSGCCSLEQFQIDLAASPLRAKVVAHAPPLQDIFGVHHSKVRCEISDKKVVADSLQYFRQYNINL